MCNIAKIIKNRFYVHLGNSRIEKKVTLLLYNLSIKATGIAEKSQSSADTSSADTITVGSGSPFRFKMGVLSEVHKAAVRSDSR